MRKKPFYASRIKKTTSKQSAIGPNNSKSKDDGAQTASSPEVHHIHPYPLFCIILKKRVLSEQLPFFFPPASALMFSVCNDHSASVSATGPPFTLSKTNPEECLCHLKLNDNKYVCIWVSSVVLLTFLKSHYSHSAGVCFF